MIKKLQDIDLENNYCLISNNGEYEHTFRQQPNFENHRTWVSNENHLIGDFWENFCLPSVLKKKGVDVFHGPAFMVPLKKYPKTVVTIHDIVSFIMPDTIPRKYAFYMRMLISLVARRADRIISVSESTKKDLMEWLRVPENKISVVHQAVSDRFRPPAPGEDSLRGLREKFGIRGKYMLFVGNLEPRKNLTRLMEAFASSKNRLGDDYQLVICGKKGWLYNDILNACDQLKGANDIVITNYASEDDLLHLYQNSDMFVFPTRYEGFGLPVLEAMACGAPVITSNISSLPEIAGDAALLIDPLSVDEISRAMIKLSNNPGLRAEMREKGFKQAAKFSWMDTARQTLEVYRSIA
ncbi:MAG: glycosyltransferase family 4 protein [Nitrospinae bacterium]|nr:glycosyltransferase family 4 protein [Nitrospinota bacterium]